MGKLSFLYATHRHDLFYITVKYHQNIPNGFRYRAGTKMFTDVWMDGQTDGRQARRYIPQTFRSGDKNILSSLGKKEISQHRQPFCFLLSQLFRGIVGPNRDY